MCLSSAETVITSSVYATPTQLWRVDIGMCPTYRTNDSVYRGSIVFTIGERGLPAVVCPIAK